MSSVDPTAELIAAHQIRQLACKFALAHDSRDMELFEHLFAPAEEALPFPRFNIVNVRETLPGYFDHAAGPTMLFVANHVIDQDGPDRATGAVYCLAKLEIEGAWIEQAILYRDVYRRLSEGWRFEQRTHLLWYGVELPEQPFAQPNSSWPAAAVGRGSLPADFPAWQRYYGVAAPDPGDHYAPPPA